MDTCFAVYLRQNRVGTVTLEKWGLFYQLECFCEIPMKERCDLKLICGENEVNLGICVPYRNGFGLRTRVKAGMLQNSQIQFQLVPRSAPQESSFYPVREDTPFDHLDKLENARLQIRENQIGIVFSDQRSMDSSRPTGQ